MERRPIRSGSQVVTFVTDRRPTHAGIDPYTYYIDRNSRDNVHRLADPSWRRMELRIDPAGKERSEGESTTNQPVRS